MRILHYPPQEGVIDSKEIGIGAHTDYEVGLMSLSLTIPLRIYPILLHAPSQCFTLLCQDGVSALQVLNNAGEWIKAPPIEGAIICNLGDQLQRWSSKFCPGKYEIIDDLIDGQMTSSSRLYIEQ